MPARPRRGSAIARSAVALAALALLASHTPAYGQETSDKLRIAGDAASHWTDGTQRVLLIEGKVSISTDDATATADRAVIWLNTVEGNYTVQIALAGHAKVVRGDLIREGGELFVTAAVKPDVKLDVGSLVNENRSTDVHYLAAAQLRRQAKRGEIEEPVLPIVPLDSMPATEPTTGPTTGPATRRARKTATTPVTFSSKHAEMKETSEGKVALVLAGDVFVVSTRANGDRVEMQADNAVIFTQFKDARELMTGTALSSFEAGRDLDAIYLEGDVRMDVTPGSPTQPQQSLKAKRVVYEFATDRAVLTDALLHTLDPGAEAPLVMRARAMRKLGTDRYEGLSASITTSDFATPSLSLSATKVTIRQHTDSGSSDFLAENVTPRLYGEPFFYFPRLWGSDTSGLAGLRGIQLSNSSGFGTGINTQWGLLETFGITKPQNIDADYKLDYYSARGPAGGVDASYSGGGVNEYTLQPFGFVGNFTSYLAYDDGQDRLGKRRIKIPHEGDLRGRINWNHQQFLPDGWQVQARAGYTSDGTFLEEWFRNEFRNGLPSETSLYLKRTDETEVFTALLTLDTSNVPTVADQLQEVYFDSSNQRVPVVVERLPEVMYDRLGDAAFDDRATFVSTNDLAGLRFSRSYDNLNELGFRNLRGGQADEGFAGIPSYAYTGYTDSIVVRGDTRDELAVPLGNDRVRITPYGVVRYTAYSDSPGGGTQDRLLAGVGVRSSTQLSKIYEDVDSKLFDIHRLRHIVEPQINLFASAATTDRDELYQYDEGIDGVSDISAAEFVIRQRFQTKRGGEERWRSVDFLTINTGVTFFGNEPTEIPSPGATTVLDDASAFRGVFLESTPEASIARSTAFADATWRVTDTTAVLGDVAWNVEQESLATTALGIAIEREPRVRYFVGVRYIGEINSTIGTITFDYEISTRYALGLHESIDLSSGQNQNTSLQVKRTFEQFVITMDVYFDQIDQEGGITFQFSPRNFPVGGQVNGRGTRR